MNDDNVTMLVLRCRSRLTPQPRGEAPFIRQVIYLGAFMRFTIPFVLLLSILAPMQAAAESKPPITLAADGFPTGQETPEGVAADLARAYINNDPAAFKAICIRPYGQGKFRKFYEEYLPSVVEKLVAEKNKATPPPGSPKKIGKVFAFRHLSSSKPTSTAYAAFDFHDIVFVDVGVFLHNGQRFVKRTMVIKDRDGKWYVHPTPYDDEVLSQGLDTESPSSKDFSEAYQIPESKANSVTSEKAKSLPTGWRLSDPPRVVGFDPQAVMAAARNLMSMDEGSVALVPMNSRASEDRLQEIMEGLKDVHSRNEPVVCLSRDSKLIADAIGRSLTKYKGLNLAGLRIVVAAPDQPPVEFVELLNARKVQYFYLQVAPSPSGDARAEWYSLNKQAEDLYTSGQYARSIEVANKALDVAEKHFGPNHSLVAASLGNIAILYKNQGRYSEVEPLYKRALEIQEANLGANHPVVADTLENLGLFWLNQKQYSLSEEYFKRALDILETKFDPNHPKVAQVLGNWGTLYHRQGLYAEAEPLYQRALSICEKTLPPNHPQLLHIRENLDRLYRTTKR